MKELSKIDEYYLTEHDWEEVSKRLKEFGKQLEQEYLDYKQRGNVVQRELEALGPYVNLVHGEEVIVDSLPAVVNPVMDLYRSEERLLYGRNEEGQRTVKLKPRT